ncbi:MAG: flagellar motor switch protein FliG [Pseudorhodobacter sp.]
MADGMTGLARITPERIAVPATQAGGAIVPRTLSGREKAAVIVRLLLAEGAPISLSALPEDMQAELAEQIGSMRLVDRRTLGAVVEEFATELEEVGLSFPGGLDGALSLMDGHISAAAAGQLRQIADISTRSDPWERIAALPPERLMPILEEEGTEVAAVMLSKLPVAKSAELLGCMTGERARRVAFAVSLTGNVDPDTVSQIGKALAAQLENQPKRAFEAGPVQRVGAILNVVPEATRSEVLAGLDEDDAGFAQEVRKTIFTFNHIAARLNPRDVSKIARALPQPQLVAALKAGAASSEGAAVTEFILANMSQRMAETLREEMAEIENLKPRDAEDAMTAVTSAIRELEAAGEIALIATEE